MEAAPSSNFLLFAPSLETSGGLWEKNGAIFFFFCDRGKVFSFLNFYFQRRKFFENLLSATVGVVLQHHQGCCCQPAPTDLL